MGTDLLLDAKLWADERGRDMDVSLIASLLELRAAYTDEKPTVWREGSVTDLLLRLWPAKGVGPVPDPATAAASLETFLRFLRNTGQMGSGSADPRTLAREARRAAPKMAAAADDRSQWSFGKVLGDHAEQIGLDLSDATTEDELRLRLEAATASWNALPVHERRRLAPRAGEERVAGSVAARDAYGVDDPIIALMMTMRHELPTGSLPEPRETAPYVRQSQLLLDMRRLLEHLGPRVEVTSTGVLRPSHARSVIDELGLTAWEVSYVEFSGWHAFEGWRSAGDAVSLDRIWNAALATGLIDLGSSRALISAPRGDLDDEQMLELGVRMFIGVVMSRLRTYEDGPGLIYALVRSYSIGCSLVTWREVDDFVAQWDYPSTAIHMTGRSHNRTRAELFTIADSGAVVIDDRGVQLTPFGDVAVSALIQHLEGL